MTSRSASVVLLHASASSARQWQSLAATLAPRFRVHAVDLHGHGEQPPWRGSRPLSLADEAALAAPHVARAGGAHVVGHSYGGVVALKLASLYPQHVRSVTLYEPVMFRSLIASNVLEIADVLRVADTIRGDLAFGSAHDAARVFIDYWSGEGAWESMSPLRRDAIATRMRSVAAQFQALFVEPLSLREVARLCIPTMVMTGECTVRVMQRMAEHLRTTLPHARHRWIAGAGHMGPITHPGAFERSVLSFLGEGQQMAA